MAGCRARRTRRRLQAKGQGDWRRGGEVGPEHGRDRHRRERSLRRERESFGAGEGEGDPEAHLGLPHEAPQKDLGVEVAAESPRKDLEYQYIEPTREWANEFGTAVERLEVPDEALERGVDEMMAVGYPRAMHRIIRAVREPGVRRTSTRAPSSRTRRATRSCPGRSFPTSSRRADGPRRVPVSPHPGAADMRATGAPGPGPSSDREGRACRSFRRQGAEAARPAATRSAAP